MPAEGAAAQNRCTGLPGPVAAAQHAYWSISVNSRSMSKGLVR